MMKKKSYRNKRISLKPKIKPSDLPSVPEAEEGYSGSRQGAGSAGFIVGDPVTYHEQEGDPIFIGKKRKNLKKQLDFKELMDALIGISDEMDKQSSVEFANFSDFLIKKIAIQKSFNYSGLFRDLLVKIVESDIINQNSVLIELTREYNRLLKLHLNLDHNMSDASREAYQGSLSKAKEYVE
jgi:hypothetical protein